MCAHAPLLCSSGSFDFSVFVSGSGVLDMGLVIARQLGNVRNPGGADCSPGPGGPRDSGFVPLSKSK